MVGRLLDLDETKVNAVDFDGMTALQHAVANGRDNLILPLLRRGAEIEVFDDKGMTPLMHAAVKGSRKSIVLLLRQGANDSAQDTNGHTPAYHAFRNSNESALLLFDAPKKGYKLKSRFGNDALEFAIATRQSTVVVYLLGIENLTKGFLRDYASKLWNVKTARALLLRAEFPIGTSHSDSSKGNVLHYAASQNKKYTIPLAKMMLELGTDLNAQVKASDEWTDYTILHFAIRNMNLDLVQFLIVEKVDLELQCPERCTPLYMAVKQGNEDIVRLLLDAGANTEKKGDGKNTPLHLAVEKQQEGILALLLDAGANIEATDSCKDTALQIAARSNHVIMTTLLLDKKADTRVTNSLGNTPLHGAVAAGRVDTADCLLRVNDQSTEKERLINNLLLLAIRMDEVPMTNMLLENGANVNSKGAFGDCGLHIAVHRGNLAMIKMLLKWDANVAAVNDNNRTASNYAAQLRHSDISSALEAAGAEPEPRYVEDVSSSSKTAGKLRRLLKGSR